jgi:hypothetical protein
MLKDIMHTPENFDSGLIPPMWVNLSFAGELYLKCLHLITNNNQKKGHDLKKLFETLHKKHRVAIKNIYNENLKNSLLVQGVIKKNNNIGNIFDLTQMLTNDGTTFVNWRYSYEQLPNLPTTLLEFVNALQQYLLNIKPELKFCSSSLDESKSNNSSIGYF